MKRIPHWRPALFDYVHAVAAKPFAWGEHDCALFAAGAIKVMTGEDFAGGYRGKYRTLAGGLRQVKRAGFANHADLAASILEEIHPSEAQIGDIAAVEEDGAIGLGIIQGERIYVLRPGDAGIGTVSRMDAKRAFRVPF